MKTHLNPPCEGDFLETDRVPSLSGRVRVGLITENDYDPTRSTRDR